MSFAQLRVISSGSLLASPIRIPELIQTAKDRGYDAVALTDINVVYNLIPFYEAATAAGIKPLLGLQVVLPDDEFILLARTDTGYTNLLKISTAIQLGAATLADLPAFAGLIYVTSGNGAVARTFATGDGNAAEAEAQMVLRHQPDVFAIGVSTTQPDADLSDFAQVHGWLAVALGDVRELTPADGLTRRALVAIADGVKLKADVAPTDYSMGQREDVEQLLRARGLPELIAQTASLVDQCGATISLRTPELPHFPLPAGQDTAAYLRELAQTGLATRLGGAEDVTYSARLDHELQVINEMGFADYFLIVADIVTATKKMGIVVGPGRGSAAGSLVAYALAITDVDPLKFNLLFERFLNINRRQMPDIDIDVQDDRRSDVLDYIFQTYGADHTAQIMATGTFGARQAVRDVARVLAVPQYKLDEVVRGLPESVKTLTDAMPPGGKLDRLARDNPDIAQLVQLAQRIEGLPRTVTTHAAGVVLSAKKLTDVVALQKSSVGMGVQTQLTKGGVERVGLLKVDILAVRTLSILKQMAGFVARNYQRDFDYEQIDLDDAATMTLFDQGNTLGIFQFESASMRRALRQVHPTNFEDIAATSALYRPGPMVYIEEFAKRMHGAAPIKLAAPQLEPILGNTYGIIVYQEQVMQVASAIGGFSLAEADDLRRAMSKKHQDVIDAGRARFIAGAQERAVTAAVAATIYDDIERFAGYGFNRSHAIAYGKLSFWMAYIRVHYPAAYYAAELNANFGTLDKTRALVDDARAAKIKFVAPDINQSSRGYRLQDDAIQVGLASIRGLRRDFIAALIAERTQARFKSLQELILRIDAKWRKAEYFEPLVRAGAFDAWTDNRVVLLAQIDKIIEAVSLSGGNAQLLKELWPYIPETGVATAADLDALAAEVLGFYLHGGPTEQYGRLSQFYPVVPLATVQGGTKMVVVQVQRLRVITTKKGTRMAFLGVQDTSGQAEVTVFPDLYIQNQPLQANAVYMLTIAADRESAGDEHKFIARAIQLADEVLADLPQQLFLNLGTEPDTKMKKDVLSILLNNHGKTPVIIVTDKQKVLLDQRYAFNVNANSVALLQDLLGRKAVALTGNDDK